MLDALNKLNITRTIITRLSSSEVEDALRTSWKILSPDEYRGKVSEGSFEVSVPGLDYRSLIHINGAIQDSAEGSIITMRMTPPLWFIALVTVILTGYAAYATAEGMRLGLVATIAFFVGVFCIIVCEMQLISHAGRYPSSRRSKGIRVSSGKSTLTICGSGIAIQQPLLYDVGRIDFAFLWAWRHRDYITIRSYPIGGNHKHG